MPNSYRTVNLILPMCLTLNLNCAFFLRHLLLYNSYQVILSQSLLMSLILTGCPILLALTIQAL